jgi:hypothetical protein
MSSSEKEARIRSKEEIGFARLMFGRQPMFSDYGSKFLRGEF